MRSRSHRLALAGCGVTLLFASACSSSPVRTLSDPKADVSHYKTYRWVADPEAKLLQLENPPFIDYVIGSSPIRRRPDIEGQIKDSIDQQLEAKGFKQDGQNPDFFVAYYGRAKDQDWESTWRGYAPSVENVPIIMYPDYSRSEARTYRDGTILIVFYDSKTKRPSWTGEMTGVLQKQGVDVATLSRDAGALTKDFPH